MKNQRIQELDFIRTVAIIMVVLVHAITRVIEIHHYNGDLTAGMESALLTLRLFATFGTPIFVFLSEFLLSHSYKEELPQDFFIKRIKNIFLPYISMGILYAFVMTYEARGLASTGIIEVFKNLSINLATGFYRHGYFILLIFQFYLLHYFFHKKLKTMDVKILLGGSLVINVSYLLLFHGIQYLGMPYGDAVVQVFTWGTAPAWIFYFAAGYVLGQRKEAFHQFLRRIEKRILPLVVISGGFLALMFFSGVLTENSSKRFDMIFFTAAMFLLLYRYALKSTYSKRITGFISRYSFGIYLLHMFYLFLMTEYMIHMELPSHPVVTLVTLTLGSAGLSIATTNLFSRFKWSTYVVGRLEVKHHHIRPGKKGQDKRRERRYLTES